jgi:hypothetical protein
MISSLLGETRNIPIHMFERAFIQIRNHAGLRREGGPRCQPRLSLQLLNQSSSCRVCVAVVVMERVTTRRPKERVLCWRSPGRAERMRAPQS